MELEQQGEGSDVSEEEEEWEEEGEEGEEGGATEGPTRKRCRQSAVLVPVCSAAAPLRAVRSSTRAGNLHFQG